MHRAFAYSELFRRAAHGGVVFNYVLTEYNASLLLFILDPAGFAFQSLHPQKNYFLDISFFTFLCRKVRDYEGNKKTTPEKSGVVVTYQLRICVII